MRRTLQTTLVLALGLLPALPALTQTCSIDLDLIEAHINDLERDYGGVFSDIGCDQPVIPAQVLMCDSAEQPEATLWRMGRLDDLAWVAALENATGQEVDLESPPRDPAFLAARDACSDVACLCAVLIDHTSASLGGTSPYPQ